MIILLYGEDTYRSRQKLNEIIEKHKKIHKSGLNFKYFNGESLDFQQFNDAIKQISMFGEKKLLLLSNVFSNQDFKEKFLKDFRRFLDLEDIILFYEENKISEKDRLLKFIGEQGKSQNFQPLKKEELKKWLSREFSKFKTFFQGKFGSGDAGIEPRALDLLTAYVGNDLWRMSNEIKKLVSFKKNEEIKVEDVGLLVKPKIETDVFETIDAIALKNKKQAILLVHKHLEKGDDPFYILSMINYQFRNLLIIKDLIERNKPYYSILKMSKLHPFVVKKSFQQAGKFTLPELKKIYQKLFRIDLDIKTGKLDTKTAIDLLIAEI